MTAPNRRAKHDAQRRQAGWKRVPVWLSPELQTALTRARWALCSRMGAHMSQSYAIEEAILELAGQCPVGLSPEAESAWFAYRALVEGGK